MFRILIVDDEPSISWGLTRLGEGMGHEVRAFRTAEEALAIDDAFIPDVVFLDVRLPGMDGLTAMAEFRRRWDQVAILIITAYGDLSIAVRAIREGAFDYIVKPFDLAKARKAIERAGKSAEPHKANREPQELDDPMGGTSAAMREVFHQIALAASSSASVLLQGESGTGKELAARAIHRHSERSTGPFVAVNLAALSPSLAESEIFGHVRGAFTGADHPRIGLLQQAEGGTLFIDEVADIPRTIQTKLLRVLEHNEVIPVGGNTAIKTNFRMLSATHRDIQRCVERGEFRHDLYFRLCGYAIELPPLRDRADDIEELARRFLRGVNCGTLTLADETLHELRQRPWYGNVRELRNAISHVATVVRDGVVMPEHLPPAVSVSLMRDVDGGRDGGDELARCVGSWARSILRGGALDGKIHAELVRCVEAPLFQAAFEAEQGNCASAARRLGIHRTTFRKRLEEYS